MGLEQVIGEVRRDGDGRAKTALDGARAQANAILDEARAKAAAIKDERSALAQRETTMVRAQVQSHSDFEARKLVLTAEAELRERLHDEILSGLGSLDAKTRDAHIKKLLKTARETLGAGTVWCSKKDEKTVKAQKTFSFAGVSDIAGGIIVESEDGSNRLDLSYETLLKDMWRDVLRSEATLFG